MRRHALSDVQWAKIEALLSTTRPGPKPVRGDRNFVDAVVYRAKTRVPWRDLPSRCGPWKSIDNCFNNWAKAGIWTRIFEEVHDLDDVEASSTHLSCELTSRRLAEQGDRSQLYRAFSWRVQHENPRAHGHERSAAPHRSNAWATTRVGECFFHRLKKLTRSSDPLRDHCPQLPRRAAAGQHIALARLGTAP